MGIKFLLFLRPSSCSPCCGFDDSRRRLCAPALSYQPTPPRQDARGRQRQANYFECANSMQVAVQSERAEPRLPGRAVSHVAAFPLVALVSKDQTLPRLCPRWTGLAEPCRGRPSRRPGPAHRLMESPLMSMTHLGMARLRRSRCKAAGCRRMHAEARGSSRGGGDSREFGSLRGCANKRYSLSTH